MENLTLTDLLYHRLDGVNTCLSVKKGLGLIIGNRVPKDYFITKGTGESDITIHAGSFHLALKSAGIEMSNIMAYSSILPAIANEIPKPKRITHGSVMEAIISVANGRKNERVTAGIIFGWLYYKKNPDNMGTEKKYGGLVCEHYGNYTVEEIKEKLYNSIMELYNNGYKEFYLREITTVTESFVPKKEYGTALVALCFTNYFYPLISVKGRTSFINGRTGSADYRKYGHG